MAEAAAVGERLQVRRPQPPQNPTASPAGDALRPRRNYVREWRKFRGKTLEALAEVAGLSASAISNIEMRKHGYTSESLQRLADALECEPGQLLSDPPPGILARLHRLDPARRKAILDVIDLVVPAKGARES